MGIRAAGQQAAMGKYLSFSRNQESSADLAGARYLSKAAVSGKGSIAFFKKLQNQEFRLAIPQTDSYARTHPLTGERIAVLQEVNQKDRSEEHTSELQSLMRISYAVFCLKKKNTNHTNKTVITIIKYRNTQLSQY